MGHVLTDNHINVIFVELQSEGGRERESELAKEREREGVLTNSMVGPSVPQQAREQESRYMIRGQNTTSSLLTFFRGCETTPRGGNHEEGQPQGGSSALEADDVMEEHGDLHHGDLQHRHLHYSTWYTGVRQLAGQQGTWCWVGSLSPGSSTMERSGHDLTDAFFPPRTAGLVRSSPAQPVSGVSQSGASERQEGL